MDDGEDECIRPPNSPLTPEPELAPQQKPQPATEPAASNSDGSRDEADADRIPTPAFGILSIRSRNQAADEMMDHPAMQISPLITSNASSGPLLVGGHPLHSVGARFVSVDDVLVSNEMSAVNEVETPTTLHEAHARAEGKLMTVLVAYC